MSAHIGSRTLVVDHVVRRETNIAVQIHGCLVHRDPELVHQIDAVNMLLPEKAELDELEALLDSPA